jgi:hypothetical protein
MTATVDRNGTTEAHEAPAVASVADDGQMGAADELARKLAEQARAEGLQLTGRTCCWAG